MNSSEKEEAFFKGLRTGQSSDTIETIALAFVMGPRIEHKRIALANLQDNHWLNGFMKKLAKENNSDINDFVFVFHRVWEALKDLIQATRQAGISA